MAIDDGVVGPSVPWRANKRRTVAASGTNESAMSNNEILREFLLETHENLALLDSDLITLEKNPTEKNTLAQVFRTLHSVKGTAGFMGLVKLQSVAHSAESLLSRLRAGEMRFNPHHRHGPAARGRCYSRNAVEHRRRRVRKGPATTRR